MGKSKQSKWFDDDIDSGRDRLNTWEQRRVAKRTAWEQKNVSIEEPAESDNRHTKKDYN